MSRRFLVLSMALVLMPHFTASAQNILMKDGKVITAKSLRRQGDIIMATQELGAGATAEMGYPVSQIQKIDFPEPAQLRAAKDLFTQGKAAEALAQIDSALRYYEGFRDAPGSWWADLALLKSTILTSEGRDKEAEPIVEQISRLATDPETVRAARAQIAVSLTRRGEYAKAVEMSDAVIKESEKPETIASAAMSKGQAHLALKQWEPALLAFLQVPVFFPDEKVLLPAGMLGVGRAYLGMEDLTRAKATFNELVETFGATAEAKAAKTELERVARLEKALETPTSE